MRQEAVDRVRLVFTLFDVDGNGALEERDFDLMAHNVVEAAPEASEAAKEAMRNAFTTYWRTLLTELDADRDGRVDFDEYRACVLSPERFDAAVTEFARALSVLGDPDGDGRVEHADFSALMTAIGFRPANIDALFTAFGPDPADRIPVDVWDLGIRDFYAPDKAGIPGDRLVPEPAL
ncbi:EF-hand domain-containing protein [uncultured Streptomyces sp.]|uniref:EF-hand domain-containing protein n=1 Tax=uncultured Streptomyces sp. TaxID=174707 RepID=UPI002615DBC1|nr:EF-hand domain-containing protein [uncultured Streptomyces sp.]